MRELLARWLRGHERHIAGPLSKGISGSVSSLPSFVAKAETQEFG